MDLFKFEGFKNGCIEHLPKVVDEILSKRKKGEGSRCAVGLITSDDFYGFYPTWKLGDKVDIREYFEWGGEGISVDTGFLYQPLVDVVDSCTEIDFCNPSEEKWDFAVGLLTVLQAVIRELPIEVFQKNHFRREDVLFFATMGDGDYMGEMLDASVKMFNTRETLEAFEVNL